MSDELRKLAEDAIASRKHMVAVGTGASCRDMEVAERAFRAAASPDVVLGLLDRIGELEAVAEVRGRGCQCGDDDACVFVQERDEAREAVRRLAGALKESMSDDSIEAYGGALQALADPVVRRIVEGGPGSKGSGPILSLANV